MKKDYFLYYTFALQIILIIVSVINGILYKERTGPAAYVFLLTIFISLPSLIYFFTSKWHLFKDEKKMKVHEPLNVFPKWLKVLLIVLLQINGLLIVAFFVVSLSTKGDINYYNGMFYASSHGDFIEEVEPLFGTIYILLKDQWLISIFMILNHFSIILVALDYYKIKE